MSARTENAVIAAALRRQGLLLREIAAEMGISISYAGELLRDPGGDQIAARRASYAGKCSDCGAPTSGSNGREKAPKLCHSCSSEPVWTRERIIAAFLDFADEHGRGPTAGELGNGPDGVEDRVEWLPHWITVRARFGSVSSAFSAAGVKRPGMGRYGRDSVVTA